MRKSRIFPIEWTQVRELVESLAISLGRAVSGTAPVEVTAVR